MLELPGFKGIKKISWSELEPGMVILGGLKIMGGLPVELRNYPVITLELLYNLKSKYHFLSGREFLIAYPGQGQSGNRMSEAIRKAEKKIIVLNEFRNYFSKLYEQILPGKEIKIDSIFHTNSINQDFLLLNNYNSFIYKSPVQETSVFSSLQYSLSIGELLSGKLKEKINLPEDKDITMHLVVDYSFSMNTMGKLDFVIKTLNSFYKYISESFLKTKILLYVFSNECLPVKFPLSGREIERKETNYSTFMKKVLRHRNSEERNIVLLFTDGKPSDMNEALDTARKMKNQKVDYLQVVFSLNNDIKYEYEFKPNSSRPVLIDGYLEKEIPGVTKKVLSEKEFQIKKKSIYDDFTKVAEA